MTNEEIIDKIKQTLSNEFEVSVDEMTPDAPLMETLDLDSLDMVDVVVLLEKNFGFTATRQELLGVHSFQDFYNLVINRLNK